MARSLDENAKRYQLPKVMTEGLAGQYILGPMFQPSAVGVLHLLSISLFAANRPYLSVAAFSLANAVYPAYLLNSALLTVSYCVSLGLQRKWRTIAQVTGISLVLAIPVAVHTILRFRPTSVDMLKDLVKYLFIIVSPTMPTVAVVQ